VHLPVHLDEDRFAGGDVADDLVAAGLEDEGLARDDPLRLAGLVELVTEDEGADAERVAEREQTVPGDRGDGRVRALDALVHALDRVEHLPGVEVLAAHLALELVREHVHQQLGVARRVEVTAVDVEQLARELPRVRQVAVVHEDDAVGRVHVERLRLFLVAGGTLGGVPDVPETHGPQQGAHVTGAEGLPHVTAGLVHVVDVTLDRGDARRVLSSVLQEEQCVVDGLVGGALCNEADDAAHSRVCSRP
jgi:phage gp46-like protein